MARKYHTTRLRNRLKGIRMLLLDVDGVLTDGKLLYDKDGVELKAFDVKDGYGLVRLREAGIKVGIITAKPSDIVETRARDLGIDTLYQDVDNKLTAYSEIKRINGLDDREIAYIGDDVPDLGVLGQVGLPIAVRDAVEQVKRAAVYITKRPGGSGAVREVIELIMQARGMPIV
ncbi:MAG: HAD hydrolase family protein [Deltaproteobacteria bacterium]|nr:HAD hydrolase family protein [Deltaproteobacteria bacterium]